MALRLPSFSIILAALLIRLASEAVLAQEPAEEVPPAVDRSRLLYIEAPIAIQSELDPILLEVLVKPASEDDPDYISRAESISQYDSLVADIESVSRSFTERCIC